ncbi:MULTISPECIES: sirohydrochlorin cobaltochelatase [Veillonella]|uniref:sirohydrochlorin cobaltochelatase n=1 Tax=Veillonella TaxID=29465 RepID=UPI000CF56E8B|nr:MULTISPECIES: sirohydrochlorin cobaltochelatase [Veillonella]MDK7739575.1 sirohydrochlorin cobaltochelatase [Veillonella nakazawae]PQL11301.1 cobalt chelatase [Veillonella sp. T11011-6]
MKKQLALASAILGLLVSFGTSTVSNAAYQLNEEVKDPTPALKEAAAIGVRTHNTEALQNLPNKDAMVVMSFGTTYKDTRAKTIDATVDAIKAAHPNTKVVTAFTSHIIRDRIQQKEGITYPTPEEALAELKKDGYTRVALASLDVIPGMEYNYDAAVYNLYKDNFKKMTLGTSLMYWMGQENQTDQVIETLKAVQSQFPKLGKEDALLIMAHGTPDPSNAYYSVIQDRIHTLGMKNVFIYTVEGTPNLEQVIPQLKLHGIKHVTLMPFMMVAGDHANNDMAGAEPDSHKSILEKEGFKVDTYLHGLGENPNIRNLFVERANESWDALQK